MINPLKMTWKINLFTYFNIYRENTLIFIEKKCLANLAPFFLYTLGPKMFGVGDVCLEKISTNKHSFTTSTWVVRFLREGYKIRISTYSQEIILICEC